MRGDRAKITRGIGGHVYLDPTLSKAEKEYVIDREIVKVLKKTGVLLLETKKGWAKDRAGWRIDLDKVWDLTHPEV